MPKNVFSFGAVHFNGGGHTKRVDLLRCPHCSAAPLLRNAKERKRKKKKLRKKERKEERRKEERKKEKKVGCRA